MTRQYQFIKTEEEGVLYLKARAEFEYKGEKHEAISSLEIEEGQEASKEIQEQLMLNIQRDINQFKLDN